jgi:hypothetical protein
MIMNTSSIFLKISGLLKSADKKVNSMMQKTLSKAVNRRVDQLTK